MRSVFLVCSTLTPLPLPLYRKSARRRYVAALCLVSALLRQSGGELQWCAQPARCPQTATPFLLPTVRTQSPPLGGSSSFASRTRPSCREHGRPIATYPCCGPL